MGCAQTLDGGAQGGACAGRAGVWIFVSWRVAGHKGRESCAVARHGAHRWIAPWRRGALGACAGRESRANQREQRGHYVEAHADGLW